MFNVSKEDFIRLWTKIDEEYYQNKDLIASIVYESDDYFVLRIKK